METQNWERTWMNLRGSAELGSWGGKEVSQGVAYVLRSNHYVLPLSRKLGWIASVGIMRRQSTTPKESDEWGIPAEANKDQEREYRQESLPLIW